MRAGVARLPGCAMGPVSRLLYRLCPGEVQWGVGGGTYQVAPKVQGLRFGCDVGPGELAIAERTCRDCRAARGLGVARGVGLGAWGGVSFGRAHGAQSAGYRPRPPH